MPVVLSSVNVHKLTEIAFTDVYQYVFDTCLHNCSNCC